MLLKFTLYISIIQSAKFVNRLYRKFNTFQPADFLLLFNYTTATFQCQENHAAPIKNLHLLKINTIYRDNCKNYARPQTI